MDLAQQVGYLTGVQEATQRELVSIRDDVSAVKEDVGVVRQDVADVRADVAGVKEDVKALNAKLDDVLATLRNTGSGGHPVIKDQGIVSMILRNPSTPIFAALLLVVLMAIVMVSALTGRTADSLVPGIPRTTPP